MKVAAIFLIACLLPLAGCQSVEGQKRLFVDLKNSEIGRPFYDHEKPGMKEVKISDFLSEFVPETIPTDRTVVGLSPPLESTAGPEVRSG